MCLGIPGQVVGLIPDRPDVASVDVGGMARDIGLGLLDGDPPEPGDWIMVHMGFALSRMTEAEARDGLEVLGALGQGFEDDGFAADSPDSGADDAWLQAMAADEVAEAPARGGQG
ncbi:hypothetical protein BH20CHL6_BH20CHL6_18070 [soil metagenome]